MSDEAASVSRTEAMRHWRVAFVLGGAGGASAICVLPYVLAVMPSVQARLAASRVPLELFFAAQSVQAFVVLTALSWIGLRVGAPLGLGAPWLRRVLDRSTANPSPARAWMRAALLGAGIAVIIKVLDLALAPMLPSPLHPTPAQVERWKGLLASFYGGIAEEIELRLFLMTVLVWIGARIKGRLSDGLFWSAAVLSALAFGAGHLPLAFDTWGVNAVNIVRTLLLNGIGGVAFGWLYWRRGLEHAMLAHFSADLVLHVALPT